MYVSTCGDFLAVVAWIGEIVKSLFPWPFFLGVLLLTPPIRKGLDRVLDTLIALSQNLRSIEFSGLKANLDPAAARRLLRQSTSVVNTDLVQRVDVLVRQAEIESKFHSFIKTAVQPLLDANQFGAGVVEFRSTIHIESVLDSERLYQLVEYYPPESSGMAEQKRGRAVSIRFGIVGKAWRLKTTQYDGEVSTDQSRLVDKWGMTLNEAKQAGHQRQSFLAHPVRDELEEPVAVIFVDAKPRHVIKRKIGTENDDQIAARIASALDKQLLDNGLTQALLELRRTLRNEYESELSLPRSGLTVAQG